MVDVGRGEPGTASGAVGPLDGAAFGDLYDRMAAQVFRYLARRVGRDSAEELTAEVFAQAWAGRHRYDPSRGDPAGWVFGIVVNVVRRHHRSADRQLRAYAKVPRDRASGDPSDSVPGALDAASELRDTVRSLEQLPALDREMILLRAWAELSYQDIAEALGVDVGAVKTRLNRARARVASTRPGGAK